MVSVSSSHHGSAPPGAIVTANLKNQLVEILRTAILSGQMSPGPVYKAAEIAEQYGASRTPVREAVLELASKGLVEVTRGVGFRVITPSSEEMLQVMEIRQALESWTMRKIAGRLSAAALKAARAMIRDIEQVARDNDLVAYWSKDRSFHAYLVSQADNPRLDALLSELRDSQRIGVLAKLAAAGNLRERNRDHSQLLNALSAGDGALAASIIHRHIELNKDDLDGPISG